jgi:hypothetical protein
MNCDMAFELMTEPQGSRSRALREHLDCCARCRQMQAALAPALEWLSDCATEPGEGQMPFAAPVAPRPAVPEFAVAEAIAIAQESAARLSQCGTPARTRFRRCMGVALRSAALVAIGGFLALALSPADRRGNHAAGRPLPDQPLVCRRHEIAEPRSVARPRAEVLLLVASCAACHEGLQATDGDDRRQGAVDRRPEQFAALALGELLL